MQNATPEHRDPEPRHAPLVRGTFISGNAALSVSFKLDNIATPEH